MRNEILPGQLRICRSVGIPEFEWMHYIVSNETTSFFMGSKKKHWKIVDVKTGESYWRQATSVKRDELVSG